MKFTTNNYYIEYNSNITESLFNKLVKFCKGKRMYQINHCNCGVNYTDFIQQKFFIIRYGYKNIFHIDNNNQKKSSLSPIEISLNDLNLILSNRNNYEIYW